MNEIVTESSDEDETAQNAFNPAQCLFCNQQSTNLSENISHMQKRHGLFIPSPESLIVEIETLLKYFHFVINEYTECLYCGSIRNTPQAAQQHMTGKGHCRIDIAKEDSEFRDFYDLGSSSDSEDDGSVGKAKANRFVELDKKTRRLESGKILFHRNANKPRNHRTLQGDKKTASESLLEGGHPLDREISTTLVIGGSYH